MEALAFMSIVYSVLSFFTNSTKLGKILMVKEKRLDFCTVLIVAVDSNRILEGF